MKELFDSKFKFKINQELRHKGDSKHSFSADMGLLVLERHIEEVQDDDGNRIFRRCYICRLIRFSGSGDLARFAEQELIDLEEHNKKSAERESMMEETRRSFKLLKDKVFKNLGIKRGAKIYLKKDGKLDKTSVYTVDGCSSKGDIFKVNVSNDEGKQTSVSALGDFEVIPEKKENES